MGMKYEVGDIVRRNFGPRTAGIVVKTIHETGEYHVQDDDHKTPCCYKEGELDWVMSRRCYFQILADIKIF